MTAPREAKGVRAHALSVMLVWPAWLAWHLYRLDGARFGLAAFVARAAHMPPVVGRLLDLSLLVGVAVHLLLGAGRVLADPGPRRAGAHASRGSRAWQRLTGTLALAFVLFSVFASPWGAPPDALYAHLDATLGQPPYLVIWVIGLTAVFAHLAEGLPVALRGMGWIGGDFALRRAQVVAALLAAAGWLVGINSLAHFAAGRALVGAV